MSEEQIRSLLETPLLKVNSLMLKVVLKDFQCKRRKSKIQMNMRNKRNFMNLYNLCKYYHNFKNR